jgi:phosphoribosylformylglycinamidine synthase
MAMASGLGARLDAALGPAHGFWFGEDQARYVVTVAPARAAEIVARAEKAGVPARRIGVTGGDALTLGAERPILVKTLVQGFEGWLPAYMAGPDVT